MLILTYAYFNGQFSLPGIPARKHTELKAQTVAHCPSDIWEAAPTTPRTLAVKHSLFAAQTRAKLSSTLRTVVFGYELPRRRRLAGSLQSAASTARKKRRVSPGAVHAASGFQPARGSGSWGVAGVHGGGVLCACTATRLSARGVVYA